MDSDPVFLPTGKLPAELLARLLREYTSPDERVKVGASVGEDAAVVDMGDRFLILKSDPITFVAEDIGTYIVQINANDIATMGGEPMWLLASILLPEKRTSAESVELIFRQLANACREIGVTLCGGHTEITEGIDRVIAVGAMIGEVEKDRLITTGGAREGDDIILTKAISVEGVSIIARQKEKELTDIFGKDFVQGCKQLLQTPGVGILQEARLAVRHGEVHAMHDPTEGGLATGLHEIAYAADVGILVEHERIPVMPECLSLCRHYGMNPLGLIASGSLLITMKPEDTGEVLRALEKEGISATRIGKVMPKKDGVKIKMAHAVTALPSFERDEIARLYD